MTLFVQVLKDGFGEKTSFHVHIIFGRPHCPVASEILFFFSRICEHIAPKGTLEDIPPTFGPEPPLFWFDFLLYHFVHEVC